LEIKAGKEVPCDLRHFQYFRLNWHSSLPSCQNERPAKLKYPPADCRRVAKQYELRSPGMWEKDARIEFAVNQKYEKLGKQTHYTDVLQCFCVRQAEMKRSE